MTIWQFLAFYFGCAVGAVILAWAYARGSDE